MLHLPGNGMQLWLFDGWFTKSRNLFFSFSPFILNCHKIIIKSVWKCDSLKLCTVYFHRNNICRNIRIEINESLRHEWLRLMSAVHESMRDYVVQSNMCVILYKKFQDTRKRHLDCITFTCLCLTKIEPRTRILTIIYVHIYTTNIGTVLFLLSVSLL